MMALDEFMRSAHRASLFDIVRLLDLASMLGRRATGLPLNPAAAKPVPPSYPSPYPDFEICLRKIYGDGSDPLASPNADATAPKTCDPHIRFKSPHH